jgi:hypothetical protein
MGSQAAFLRKFTIPCALLGAFMLMSFTGALVHSSAINYDLYAAADSLPAQKTSLQEQIRLLEIASQRLQRQLSERNWSKIEAEMETAATRVDTFGADRSRGNEALEKIQVELEKMYEQLRKGKRVI